MFHYCSLRIVFFFFSSSFYSHFRSPVSFTFIFKFCLILCCFFSFISYLCCSICYPFFINFYISYPTRCLQSKMLGQDKQFSSFFSSLNMYENPFYFLLHFFMETCFKFYFIAILICDLYFIIYCRAHNVFGTLRCVSSLAKFVPGGVKLVKK